MTKAELEADGRALNAAYRRVRGGLATSADLDAINAHEARLTAWLCARPLPVPATVFDLPIARRMWPEDARDTDA